MTDFFVKIFGYIIDMLWPGKLKEFQIKIRRLNLNSEQEIQDFIDVYEEAFPYDGSNYSSGEILDFFQNIHTKKRHVKSDNIALVAKYKDSVIGFIICFYYPQKKYGIIGYFGKSNSHKDIGKYIAPKLLKELKSILLNQHKCKLLVFELESQKRSKAKIILFKLFATKLNFTAYELDFDYFRPKYNLEDTNTEEKLSLFVIPISESLKKYITKKKVIDILNFIHFYCYGDYYDATSPSHVQFQNYMKARMKIYDSILPDKIKVK